MDLQKKARISSQRGESFWHPVEDSTVFQRGEVVFLAEKDPPGHYRVIARGRREILVEGLSEWDLTWRMWRGHMRRLWVRITRR